MTSIAIVSSKDTTQYTSLIDREFGAPGERIPVAHPDRDVVQILEAHAYTCEVVEWETLSVERAAQYDHLLMRSLWNYHKTPELQDQFDQFLDAMDHPSISVLNSIESARWNKSKRYLSVLSDEYEVPIVDSEILERGSARTLLELRKQHRTWDDLVIKPAISGDADGAWLLSEEIDVLCRRLGIDKTRAFERLEDRFLEQLSRGDLIVQRFYPEISRGESSLAFFGGKYCGTIRKVPGPGEWKCNERRGGIIKPDISSDSVIAQARRVLDCAQRRFNGGQDFLYARVDGFESVANGRFVLMELEVIDPSFYIHKIKGSNPSLANYMAESFAKAIMELHAD